jgi:vacuolar-type H+-ATPase subunit E/Vma4
MVVETWIEMLKEKLKHISSLLRLGASVEAFLRAWTSSVHQLVG